nr:CcdB family protein [Desulfonatronovibrio magnus]
MATQFMAAVPVSILGKAIGNLESRRIEIVTAIDFLMQGY